MKKTILILSVLILLPLIALTQTAPQAAASADQVQGQPPLIFASGTLMLAEMTKSVDAKKAKVGDPVEARTTVDMLSNGKIVLPRNTKVLGHVASVKARSKDSPDSMLGIAFDRLVMKDGHEMQLAMAVQAIGAPMNAFSSAAGRDPDAPLGPMGSPGSRTASSGGTGRNGSSTATLPGGLPVSTDGSAPQSSASGALSASSQGVVGLKDLSLSATPEASVVSSANKNVHLDGSTQLLLKVQ